MPTSETSPTIPRRRALTLCLSRLLLFAGALGLGAADASARPGPGSSSDGRPVLTLTAVSGVAVRGDPMPPLIWAATGWVNGDTIASASTGRPVLSTTATASSSPGTYPITLAVGDFAAARYHVTVVPGTLEVLPPSAVGARTRKFAFPSDAMINVESYGVVHDGKTDDTAALLTALGDKRGYIPGTQKCADFANGNRSLYFPPGVYRFTQQLTWPCGAETMLQGAGPTETILRLDDRSAAFNGSSNLGALKIVSAVTPNGYGNIAFRNFVSGMTVDLGVGNSKAYGIDYTASNVGSMRDVRVISQSSDAAAGLYLATTFPGPELIKDVAVYGGKYGIQAGNQALYSETYSHLTIAGQTAAAIYAPGMHISGEQILTCTRGFAIQSGGQPIAIINSTFTCGANASPAIQSGAPAFYRNITIGGYTRSLVDAAHNTQLTGNISEWFTPGRTASAFPGRPTSLNLPVKEAPEVSDAAAATWCKLTPEDPSQWSAQLLSCRGTTAYTPAGESTSRAGTYDINVPPGVNHIRLFNHNRKPFGQITLNLNIGNGPNPLLIEAASGKVNILHKSTRVLVLKDFAGSYTAYPGSGNLFGEDVGLGQGGLITPTTTFYPDQQVYIRQLNVELQNVFAPGKDYKSKAGPCDGKTTFVGQCLPPEGVKLLATGAQLWILGYKTEESTTELMLRNQAQAEIVGMYMLPNKYNVQPENRAFDVADSSLAVAGVEEYIYANAGTKNSGHPHMLIDNRRGSVKTVDTDQNAQQQFSLLFGFGQTARPAASQVTLTANPPPNGGEVAPGSDLKLSVNEKGGATGLINWSVIAKTGGAAVTLYDLNASPTVARLSVGPKSGPCSSPGGSNAARGSAVSFTVQAQSVDDPSKTVLFPFSVCGQGNAASQ